MCPGVKKGAGLAPRVEQSRYHVVEFENGKEAPAATGFVTTIFAPDALEKGVRDAQPAQAAPDELLQGPCRPGTSAQIEVIIDNTGQLTLIPSTSLAAEILQQWVGAQIVADAEHYQHVPKASLRGHGLRRLTLMALQKPMLSRNGETFFHGDRLTQEELGVLNRALERFRLRRRRDVLKAAAAERVKPSRATPKPRRAR